MISLRRPTTILSSQLLKPIVTQHFISRNFSTNQKPHEPMEILKSLSPFLWPKKTEYRVRVVTALSCLILAKVSTIYVPIALGSIVNSMAKKAPDGNSISDTILDTPEIAIPYCLIAGFGLARLGSSGFAELRSALFARVSQSACKSMAISTFDHIHSLPISYLQSSRSGEIQTVVNRGVKAVTSVLNMMLFNVVPTLIEFGLVLTVLTRLCGIELAGITSITMLAYVIFTTKITSIRTKLRMNMNRAESQVNNILLDSLTNCENIRYFQNEKYESERYGRALSIYEENNIKVLTSLSFLNFGQNLIFTMGTLSILSIACSKVAVGLIPVGSLVTISTLLFQLAIPLNFIGSVYRETRLNLVDMSKLHRLRKLPHDPFEIKENNFVPYMDNLDRISTINSNMLETVSGNLLNSKDMDNLDIEFHNVTVYPDREGKTPPILSNINLNIPTGSRVAIVGPSGSGKSSIFKSLLFTRHISDGYISIGGKKIENSHDIRKLCSIVPQEGILFNESILSNIGYGNVDLYDECIRDNNYSKIIEAAQIAQVIPPQYIDYSEKLSYLSKTIVGERGSSMSGGERQRIAIARAFLRNAPITLFDEATSSLDLKLENDILTSVEELFLKSKTTVLIAHRLSTVVNCDLIYYIENGRVMESGTHKELMDIENGKYRDLFNFSL